MYEPLHSFLSRCPSYAHWKKIGIRPHHGINIPLFSLRSYNSCGIGEFTDLKPLTDWCVSVGMDVIQLLPLNYMGFDHSPYNSLSSCALDPIYIGLKALPDIDDPFLQEHLNKLSQLNKEKRVHYTQVKKHKYLFLNHYFEKHFVKTYHSDRYQKFLKQNPWLDAFCLFIALKDNQEPLRWDQWPEKLQNPSQERFEGLLREFRKRCDFERFLQFWCFNQMADAKSYANNKKVFIKGDIPILINKNSADVWHYRKFFDVEHSAGCPPDDFNHLGQNWGFPIYNWEALKAHDFSWWRQRLNVSSSCYDLYRIDHAVGFFRIWTMKNDEKKPTNGHFIPKSPRRWAKHGTEKLQMMLDASLMLPIAEDLGIIPRMSYIILRKLGICGTKILRWQKKRGRFTPYKNYEPLSITTIGTHDQPLLNEWWKHSPNEVQAFCKFKKWAYHPKLSLEYRTQILSDSHHTASLFHVNLFSEYLSLYPELSWVKEEDQRINIPGVYSINNWCYRIKIFLEDLNAHEPLKDLVRQIISPID